MSETEVREIFDLFDENKKGFLPFSDLESLCQSLGYRPLDKQNLIKIIGFDGVDTTQRNKPLAFDQVLSVVQRCQELDRQSKKNNTKENEVREWLKVFDKDGDGTVVANELRHILTNLGQKYSELEVEEFLRNADVDEEEGSFHYDKFVMKMEDGSVLSDAILTQIQSLQNAQQIYLTPAQHKAQEAQKEKRKTTTSC